MDKYGIWLYTGETVGYIVYYRTCWNIVASVLKLPEQNQLSKMLIGS